MTSSETDRTVCVCFRSLDPQQDEQLAAVQREVGYDDRIVLDEQENYESLDRTLRECAGKYTRLVYMADPGNAGNMDIGLREEYSGMFSSIQVVPEYYERIREADAPAAQAQTQPQASSAQPQPSSGGAKGAAAAKTAQAAPNTVYIWPYNCPVKNTTVKGSSIVKNLNTENGFLAIPVMDKSLGQFIDSASLLCYLRIVFKGLAPGHIIALPVRANGQIDSKMLSDGVVPSGVFTSATTLVCDDGGIYSKAVKAMSAAGIPFTAVFGSNGSGTVPVSDNAAIAQLCKKILDDKKANAIDVKSVKDIEEVRNISTSDRLTAMVINFYRDFTEGKMLESVESTQDMESRSGKIQQALEKYFAEDIKLANDVAENTGLNLVTDAISAAKDILKDDGRGRQDAQDEDFGEVLTYKCHENFAKLQAMLLLAD